jgi:hypothetical protein
MKRQRTTVASMMLAALFVGSMLLTLGGCGGGTSDGTQAMVPEAPGNSEQQFAGGPLPSGQTGPASHQPAADAEEPAGNDPEAAMPAAFLPGAGEVSAMSKKLYDWVVYKHPYLTGYSSGTIPGHVYAGVNFRRDTSSGKVSPADFKIALKSCCTVRGRIDYIIDYSGKPCKMVVDPSDKHHMTLSGTAKVHVHDQSGTTAGDYILQVYDKGNSQTPRDHMDVFFRTGTSGYQCLFSFDCDYQGADAGDLVVKLRADKPY